MFALSLSPSVDELGTYAELRQRLHRFWDHRTRADELPVLFRSGDERVDNLVHALDDSDKDVSRAAQWMIRYLGNPKGMAAVRQWLDRRERTKVGSLIIGPSPLPLTDWEYKWIEDAYLGEPVDKWPRQDSFVYALALDGTSRSKELLKELKARVRKSKEGTFTARTIQDASSYKQKTFSGPPDIPQLALENAFFIPAKDRKCCTRARLIAYSGGGDKALVELYVNRGVLAEEWWHVVVVKDGGGWRFFWVDLIMVS